ncbi:MAG TPA: hypothetical protein VIR03_02080 [Candidatus Saccharimonadales bacterium]
MNNIRKWLVVGGIILLIVAGVIGFVASKFGDGNKKAGSAAKSNNSSSTVKKQPGISLHTPNEAIALVQTTYLEASAYVSKGNAANQGEIDAIKKYMDGDLYAQLSQTLQVNMATGDQILCTTTGGATSGYTVSLYRYSGATAQVMVTEKYDTPISVVYTVDLASLKITNIVCQTGS